MNFPFVTKKYGYVFIIWKGYLKRIKKIFTGYDLFILC